MLNMSERQNVSALKATLRSACNRNEFRNDPLESQCVLQGTGAQYLHVLYSVRLCVRCSISFQNRYSLPPGLNVVL